MTFLRVVSFFFVCLAVCSLPLTQAADQFDTMLTEDADVSELLGDIEPLDISSVTAIDLTLLPMISPEQAMNVIAYRDSVGHHAFAVSMVPGLTGLERMILSEAIRRQGRTVSTPQIKGSLRSGYRYRPTDETPADAKYYIRGTFDLEDRISATILGSRDPAEPQAFDAYSASITLRFNHDRTYLIVGDYRPSFGQRLVYSRYSRSYTSGSSAYATLPTTIANTSFEETRFLRGMFARFSTHFIHTDMWVSQRGLDATLDTDGHAITIRDSGLHPTGALRENLTERLAGVSVSLHDQERWQIGVLGTVINYNPALAQADGEQNLHDPVGDDFGIISLAGDYRFSDGRLYGEHAHRQDGEHASNAGIEMKIDEFRGVIAARSATPGYWTVRSAGINSFGNPGNEEGIYTGFDSRIAGKGLLSASYDIARTKTRTATVSFSRARRRMNVRFAYPVSKDLLFAALGRFTDDIDTGTVRRVQKATFEYALSSRRTLLSVFARTDADGTTGAYTESILRTQDSRFGGSLGIAAFRIPSYAARYYRYEPDMPGTGMMHPIWGNGCSLLVQLKVAVWSIRYRLVAAEKRLPAQELAFQADIRW